LNSLNALCNQPTRRCGPISTFSGTSGAGFRPAHKTSPSPSAAWRAARQREGRPHESLDALGHEVGVRRDGFRRPRAVALDFDRHRLEVEKHRRDVHARHAVDQRVVGLGDQGEAVVLEALHEPDLPERLRPVEPLREDTADELAQLRIGPGPGEGGMADVVVEVEARIVDPERPAHLEARVGEPLSVTRHEPEARRDVGAQLLPRWGRSFEHDDGSHVHVRGPLLLVQE
jgi:hypothetical protein